MRHNPRTVLPVMLLGLLSGCAIPVAGGLDEGDANRIVIALDRVNIEATKETDATTEGKFRVTVARDEAARAITAMQSEELPRPRALGVLDAIDRGALVPSEAQEHAQLVAGIAGDLERTLESIDGILRARVHLNVPPVQPWSMGPPPKSTAAVMLEHRGVLPPVSEGSVARLVAGGVPGLSPSDVAVVMVTRPAPARATDSDLSHVGPIRVARTSTRLLQYGLVGLLAVLLALAALTLALFSRLKRLAAAAAVDAP